jgi:molybdenum cofactor synthesis domain-containing protein
MAKTAGIIIIGDEILSGETMDTNSAFLCQELRALGVAVRRIHIVPDDISQIAEDVRLFSQLFDVVLTSGGVGPTHDDVTMEGIALGLQQKLVVNPIFESLIRQGYGVKTRPEHLKMACVPEGSELLQGGEFWFPVIRVENVYIFPGIPEILKYKFDAIRSVFQDTPFFRAQIFVNCDEGEIAEILHRTVQSFPELHLGSYPTMRSTKYKIKLNLDAKDKVCVLNAFNHLLQHLPDHFIVDAISAD